MSDLTKQQFVEREVVWLLEGCLADLRAAAADPRSVKYEALLATCETASNLIARFASLSVVQDEPEAARSAPEVPLEKFVLLAEILSLERTQCPHCDGWRRSE
ncbi:MAG: hypothetical protein AAF674_07015 [Pseudomonadota bacterium]